MKNGTIAVAVGLAVVLGMQVYGLLKLSALEARVERSAALSQLALARPVAKPQAPFVAPAALQLGSCVAPSAAELRAIVKEELAQAAATAQSATELEAEPADPVENADAFRSAQRLVRDAMAARVWGEQDAQQLRQLRHQLTGDQIQSLNAQLIPAMNRQELRVDAARPF